MGKRTPLTVGPPDHQYPYPPPRTAWFAVGVLMLAYIVSFVDRFVLSLLVEPIKADLALSDVQISLLQGFSFALFYTLAAFPIGRLVDSKPRTLIIAVGIAFWSLMTAMSGLGSRYWHLLVARMGVGVGEASLVPAAYSLIADYFRRERLGLAMGVFSLGASMGAGLAFMFGGYVVQWVSAAGAREVAWLGVLQPWQLTFIWVGLPGLLVAALVAFQRDPPRRGAGAKHGGAPLKSVLAYLRANARTVTLHHAGQGISAFAGYAILSWTPTLLIRIHGWSVADAGIAVGGSVLVAGTVGVLAGGWMGDRLVSQGRLSGRLTVSAVSMLVAAAGASLFPLQTAGVWIIGLFALTILGCYVTIGGMAAALQEIFPNRMRGQASALYLLATSVLGMGSGPTVVALLTDRVFADPMALPYSLAIAPSVALLIGAICLFLGRAPFERSIENARLWELSPEAAHISLERATLTATARSARTRPARES